MSPRSVFNSLRPAILAYSPLSDDFFFFFFTTDHSEARDSRPLFDHKFRIGVNANIQGIVQLRTKSRSISTHVPFTRRLFLFRRGEEPFLFWLCRAPPKFIPPSRGSQPPFLPSCDAHVRKAEKSTPALLFVRVPVLFRE